MGEVLKKRKLSSFLAQVRRQEKIENDEVYRLLGVKWYGKGVFIREVKKGKDIKADKLYRVKTGDFIYNRLFAWKSSFAIIPDEFSDCLVSSEFPLFNLKNDSADLEYLLRFILLPHNIDGVNRLSGGMSSVSRKRFKEDEFLNFEIPSIAADEQRKITSYITGIENNLINFQSETKNQTNRLSQLRQAILQDAIEGKLTADWRIKNPVHKGDPDTDAASLLEKIKTKKQRLIADGKIKKEKPLTPIKMEEIPFDLPGGWVWCRLGEITELITSGSRDWARHYRVNGSAKFVRMGDLSHDWFELKTERIQTVEPPASGEGTRTALMEDDLLISITGDVGWKGLVPKDFGEAYINQHTALVRFIGQLRGRFYPITLCSPFSRKQFDYPQRGIKNSFRLTDVSNHIVPLPPLSEQAVIVERVDRLLAMVGELEKQVTERKEQTEMLMQAVLREAFEGNNG